MDRKLARCWSKCPLAVAREAGRCFRTMADVKPGALMKPASMAVQKVDGTGEKKEAWRYWTRSDCVLEGTTELAAYLAGGRPDVVDVAMDVGGVVGTSMVHKEEASPRVPCIIMWPSR